jgi:hypothetical protein
LEAFLRVSRGKITKKRGTPTSYVIPKKKSHKETPPKASHENPKKEL